MDNFYKELERVLYQFPNHYMNILSGNIKAKVEREYIFKPRNRNESLNEINNDDGMRIANFATSKKNCQ